jgi:hypothetical protein
MEHRVRVGRQPAEQVRIPEPELVLLEAVVVEPEEAGEDDDVVGDAGMADVGAEPSAQLLRGPSELRSIAGIAYSVWPKREEFPEDGA